MPVNKQCVFTSKLDIAADDFITHGTGIHTGFLRLHGLAVIARILTCQTINNLSKRTIDLFHIDKRNMSCKLYKSCLMAQMLAWYWVSGRKLNLSGVPGENTWLVTKCSCISPFQNICTVHCVNSKIWNDQFLSTLYY